MENQTRNLPVKLTDDELDTRRDRLAEELRNADILEAEKKIATKHFSDSKKILTNKIYLIAEEIRTKTEYREVEVYLEKNFDLGVIEVRRVDTGEIVGSQPLTHAERQMSLVGDEPVEAALAKAKRRASKSKPEVDDEAMPDVESEDGAKIAHLRDIVRKTSKAVQDGER